MKNFKRILAMALAATLLLSFLTACSQTDHTASEELGQAWIEAELSAINRVRSDGVPTLDNDLALKALCDDALSQLKDGTTRYGMGVLYKEYPAGDGYTTYLTIFYDDNSLDENNTRELAPLTAEYLENLKDKYRDGSQDFYDRYQAVGYSYRVFSDGTVYIALAHTSPILGQPGC